MSWYLKKDTTFPTQDKIQNLRNLFQQKIAQEQEAAQQARKSKEGTLFFFCINHMNNANLQN